VKCEAWERFRTAPTEHDYAVPTREYQTDQSPLKTAPTAARFVFGKRKRKLPKQSYRSRPVDAVTPYQGDDSLTGIGGMCSGRFGGNPYLEITSGLPVTRQEPSDSSETA
jgi:hypothetical protein